MANCAGIPDSYFDVQLFTRAGEYVTTVALPVVSFGRSPGVVIWGSRFFRYEEGRYVETLAYTSTEKPH